MKNIGKGIWSKKVRTSELWNILDVAEKSLEIYGMGRNPFNIFCGDVPERMFRLLGKGVQIEAYYPIAKSGALENAMAELGLTSIKVHCLCNGDFAKRSFCILDGNAYIAEAVFTEGKMEELRGRYPLFNDEEIMDVADDFLESGNMPDKLALYKAYIGSAKTGAY